MPQDTTDPAALAEVAKELRVEIIRMLVEAGSGHPGGSLSEIDMLTSLYFGGVLRYDASRPDDPSRDRFVLSKGHCSPGMYAVLARAGFFPHDWLKTFRKLESPLQGHVDRMRVPGVEVSSGSLGQGLSVALGLALGARVDKASWDVWCMLGDGETQAGQVWEAILAAGNLAVDNLTAIVDFNQVQQTGFTAQVQDLEPLEDKFRAFKWNVLRIDGHDIGACLDALRAARTHTGQPTAIVSVTKKGKGVSWMELDYNWHGKAPKADEAERAIAEITAGGAR